MPIGLELQLDFLTIHFVSRFLDAMEMRQTKAYAVNGAFLFFSFLIARMITMPLYYITLYSVYDYPAFQVSHSMMRFM